MEQKRRYQYQPLHEPDAIRLICLQPCPTLSAKVHCTILHSTLSHYENDTIEHYTALSYVWGDPHLTATISVDGFDLEITANLDSALRHIRDATRVRRVWADAICINQRDNEEKAQQVRQMGEVYRIVQHTTNFSGEFNEEFRGIDATVGTRRQNSHF
jgi:hypothetical protein